MKNKKLLFFCLIAIVTMCLGWSIVILKRHSGEFAECTARLNSETLIEQEDNIQTVERYISTNFVTCKCVVMYINNKMYTMDKEKEFRYTEVQSKEELDCNNKCIEICR